MRTQNEKSKRIWDRQNYCIYCNKSFSKLPRHFESKHSREIEVAQILSKTKGSKERKWMWSVLENKGNHVHNTQVLSKGQGTLVPAMRQSCSTSANDYLPCEHCLGYYIRHDLWKHKKRCPSLKLKGVDPSKGRTQGRSALLLPFPITSSEAFSHHVLGKMNSDEIGLIVRQDDLILKFGLRMFMKLSEPHQYQYISQKMRMLGRLVLTMRELSGSSISSLEDAVCPRQFKNVTEAVRHVAGFDPVKKLYQTPSLALKIGHSLKACAAILKGEALQSLDKVGQEAAESFEDLCSLEWSTEVSHHALGTLAKRHWNKPQNLPLGEDVVKLNRHLKKVAQDNAEKLCKDPSDTSAWYELSKATLCQLIVFNRRRAGEVERLLVEECSKITDEMNSDILNSLSEWEQNLCKKLMRLEIRGKRGRRVPVLMTQALHTNVRNLISARSRVNVSESNIYLFARPFPSPHSLRGHDCIRQFSIECNVSHPENLTSTKLRKQIGTMSQVFNLQNNELDILATFMGHDINVHRDFYRLPERTLQLVKVSRILLAMEQGKLIEFKGKALDDIEIDVDGEFPVPTVIICFCLCCCLRRKSC
ncbi:hypothetical protein HOLleu_10822 [Holothuria leucospilota]|uniref:Uncharacterized protein n=1 Tax=Holothuria leucospilota TaxID=206669 RepID=A0A9Q1HFZ6_HOLLE|nr:hypothetical protein HOLleu_10822 [Holothuria leucospilota]